MIEDGQYELQCDVQNVAPVKFLTVSWYKGDTLVSNTTFSDPTKTPVNQSTTLQITPSRVDDGAQYTCVAELDLGPDGPQPPPTVRSDPIIITTQDICPVTLQPSKVVVQYKASVTANCSTSVGVMGMGWEASQGPVDTKPDVQFITWSVDRLVEWDIQPFCFINPKVGDQCQADLSVTVYKLPDRVSISTVGHTGPMIEGRQYELLCDIQNVAPVKFLTVKWFKGDTLVSNTTFSDSTKTPVNLSSKLQKNPIRNDDGAQYRCVAELDLGPDGPQPPPTVTSDPLIIAVYVKLALVSCLLATLYVTDRAKTLSSLAALQPVAPSADNNPVSLALSETPALCTNALHLDPPRVVVSYGDPVSVNCSTNETYLKLAWETAYGDTKMIGTTTITWTVEELKDFDARVFCFMVDKEYNSEQAELNITVYKTPDKVTISTVGHSGPMIEGRKYELQCDVQNVAPVEFLTVSWYKGDTLVNHTTFNDSTKTPVTRSTTLQIIPSRDDNGAQYRCVAELDLGPDGPQPPPTVTSDSLNMTVYYGPEIVSCPSNVIVTEGEVFTSPCSITGFPQPEITWYKDEEIVDFSQPMNKRNAGQYTLLAINDNTNATHTLEIEVLYKPVRISELQSKSVAFGNTEELRCFSDSKPRPQYRWNYTQASNVGTQDTDGVSLLSIDYATGRNTGTYTCTATNKLGTISKSVTVNVQGAVGKVSIKTVGHNGPMIEGKEYEFRCDVRFDSPVHFVNVSWYKGDRRVKSTPFNISSTTNIPKPVNLSDTFKDSHSRTDNGTQYKCTAEIRDQQGQIVADGEKSALLTIIVHYKPIINISKLPSVVPVFRGYPEVLICEAEGYPQPDITWTTKENTKADKGNLTIIEATNENVGIYNCTASNSVETTVRMVKVIMKEIPRSASISVVGHSGPMVEGGQYELQCDIQKVASVEFLTVSWYKGDTLVDNLTFTDSTKDPGNVSTRLQISPSRDDNGAEYRCEAELMLNWNRGGTQASLKVSSPVLGITVTYGMRTTFWAVVGSFVGLAVVMILAYVLKKRNGQY
ncbi:hypothetical protein NFI96_025261 [Prochilodus magdalenae]|nr:hypothetical protein NFI96_025261 [Prochilodus magdalenae]